MSNDKPESKPKESAGKIPLKHLASHLFAVVYEDDGPIGICGQSCSMTCPWHKLYLFEKEDTMHSFIRKISESVGRKNARITKIFHPQPISDEINFIEG